MIEWSKLKSYRDDQRKSFEELCYQIAKGLYGERGTFTSIDDSGGGDGVEFYMTLPDGDEWGWQAKFFKPGAEGRLDDGGRKRQIKKSLKKACKVHPNLKRFFLWTPSSFTAGEQSWFENVLRKDVPQTHVDLEMIHQDQSDFLNWLSEPRFSGIRHFFFGELELTMDWFQRRFNEALRLIGDKYIPILHIETSIDSTLHALVGDGEYVEELIKRIGKVEFELASFAETVRNLHLRIPDGIEWGNQKDDLIKISESLQYEIGIQIALLWRIFRCLNEQRMDLVRRVRSEVDLTKIEDLCQAYYDAEERIKISDLRYSGQEDARADATEEALALVNAPIFSASEILSTLSDLHKRLTWLTAPDLHIFGGAHKGKTHVVTNFCREHLDCEGPALLISGKEFRTNDALNSQLLKILGVPQTYGWDDFLGALDSAAAAYRTRLPIIIDGLNESVVNGRFSAVWMHDLEKCIQSFAEYDNIVLITTCRSSYARAVWPEHPKDPERAMTATGFNRNEIAMAVDKYFDYYRLYGILRQTPLFQFREPMYLRIFCESENPDRAEPKTVHVGNESMLDVFDRFLRKKNTVLCRRLDKHESVDLLFPALRGLAKKLWESSSRTIPLDEYVQIVDHRKLEDIEWENSLSRALLDEGLLISRDMISDDEAISFTYDMMAGYRIAVFLSDEDKLNDPAWRQEVFARLFNSSGSDDPPGLVGQHPLAEDIRNCLAASLLSRLGIYFHELFPEEAARVVSLKALFEISPHNAPSGYTNEVFRLFGEKSNRSQLFENAKYTMGIVRHPLNAPFWSDLLKGLPLPERDAYWTEFIRKETSWVEFIVDSVELSCRHSEAPTEDDSDAIHLLAILVMWFLTSTVRRLRDLATRALYWYGRCFPAKLFEMTIDSLQINDPYVPERMLAASYGIAMAKVSSIGDRVCSDELIIGFARQLFEAVFSENAPHATTHILSRDYAASFIEAALMVEPALLREAEAERTAPPFREGGIREWGELVDMHESGFRPYDDPMQNHFANYTLGSLVPGRMAYEDDHPGYRQMLQQIRWRIYDLGYSEGIFRTIDERIRERNTAWSRSANEGKIDRYGKKYSWIAFYEMAGFRVDQGISLVRENERRFAADIDPSFPEEQEETEVITVDLLGDRESSLDEWIDDGPIPDLSGYLVSREVQDTEGPWVLLDGSVSQEDRSAHRRIRVSLSGIVVPIFRAEDLVLDFSHSYANVQKLSPLERDIRYFAGEVPWRNGSRNSGRIELTTVDPDTGKEKKYQVTVPVRDNVWSSEVSYANPGREIAMPVWEITRSLRLVGMPQTYNMHDEQGKLAILALESGSSLYSRQYQTYIRKDLLIRYLSETESELVWAVWGQRDAAFDQDSEFKEFAEKRRDRRMETWREFHIGSRSSGLL